MAGRKIANRTEARAALSALRTTGMSAAEWARARGVDGRSVHAWQMNLVRGAASARRREDQGIGLVELVPRANTERTARYALVVGDARLEFDDHCSMSTLGRVLEVLRSC